MNVFETTVRFYTDHNFVGGENEHSFDDARVRSILVGALKHMDDREETIVGEFVGVIEFPASSPTARDDAGTIEPVRLLQRALRANATEATKSLALERFRDSISTYYGMSDLDPRIEGDQVVVEKSDARYPRVLVTVMDAGVGESQEEAADDSMFRVRVQPAAVAHPDMAGSSLTLGEARVLVVGIARTFLQ
jgi:hypothetical protein